MNNYDNLTMPHGTPVPSVKVHYWFGEGDQEGVGEFRSELSASYVGTWKIIDDRLYLIKLKNGFDKDAESCMAEYFPEQPDRVFANWYSGKLRLPQGELLKYVHGGYASIYESDMFLTIKKGILTKVEVCHNANPDASEGDCRG